MAEQSDTNQSAETQTENTEGAETNSGGNERTFSQADVDRIVQERLARDRKDRPSEDELKKLRDAAKKLEDIEAANQSELERAQTEREREKAEKEKIAAELRQTRIENAIVAEAAKADRNVVDVAAVVTFLTGSEKALLDVGDDGTPKNTAEAVDALLKAKSYLVSGGTRQSADQGARGGSGPKQVTREQLRNMSPAEVAKAEKEGRLVDITKGA